MSMSTVALHSALSPSMDFLIRNGETLVQVYNSSWYGKVPACCASTAEARSKASFSHHWPLVDNLIRYTDVDEFIITPALHIAADDIDQSRSWEEHSQHARQS